MMPAGQDFDPKRMGCPLVQLTKSCHAMRENLDCPKWQKLLVRDTRTGADDAIWGCADWWQAIILRDLVAVSARTEKAVETRGDRLLSAANQQAMLLLKLGTDGEIVLQEEVSEIFARAKLLAPDAPGGAGALRGHQALIEGGPRDGE